MKIKETDQVMFRVSFLSIMNNVAATKVRQLSFVGIDLEIFSTVIQEGQLSVCVERMCTRTVLH